MSAARRARRVVQLELRRQAKRRGIERGSRKHLVWLALVQQGQTYDDALALIEEWDAEELANAGVAVGEGTL